MPTGAPTFRPPGWREREPWERPTLHRDKRLRGRAGQKERREILAAEPMCRSCAKDGKQVQATVVDHIMPLAWGGAEARSNKQPLCTPCHDAKSLAERQNGRS